MAFLLTALRLRSRIVRSGVQVIFVAILALVTESLASAGDGRMQLGFATYYAQLFDGRVTASGTRFDNDAMVAAHPTYPFGTILRVTNLRNQRSVRVRVVDRGPARGPRKNGVVIDLSRAAAERLGFIRAGRTRVRVEVIGPVRLSQ